MTGNALPLLLLILGDCFYTLRQCRISPSPPWLYRGNPGDPLRTNNTMSNTPSTYKVAQATTAQQELLRAIAEFRNSDDYDQESESIMTAAVRAIAEDREAAVDALVDLKIRLDADEVAAKAALALIIGEYQARIDSIQSQRNHIESGILRLMETGALPTKLPGRLHKISEHPVKSVKIDDESLIPADLRHPPKDPPPNKIEIGRRLKEGIPVEGAQLVTRKTLRFGAASQRDRLN